MNKKSILYFIERLQRPIFTTYELAALSGKSLSTTTQTLNNLQKQEVIFKIYRGIWVKANEKKLSPYSVIKFLFSTHPAYVSFTSALHIYDIVEQIPKIITLASTAHTKMIYTKIGTFSVHRIAPNFFKGFDWYQGQGDFLIAGKEKALVDSLYLSAFKKKRFGYFPELYFPETFSFKKAEKWTELISNAGTRFYVQNKLNEIKNQNR